MIKLNIYTYNFYLPYELKSSGYAILGLPNPLNSTFTESVEPIF